MMKLSAYALPLAESIWRELQKQHDETKVLDALSELLGSALGNLSNWDAHGQFDRIINIPQTLSRLDELPSVLKKVLLERGYRCVLVTAMQGKEGILLTVKCSLQDPRLPSRFSSDQWQELKVMREWDRQLPVVPTPLDMYDHYQQAQNLMTLAVYEFIQSMATYDLMCHTLTQ